MRKINLTKGKYALIDDEDYSLVSRYKWHIHFGSKIRKRFYAVTGPSKKTNNQYIFMHKLVMCAQSSQQVDHKEHHEGYIDNCKSNLRFCTNAQNQHNARKQLRKTSSQYKGVSFNRNTEKWSARINLGSFDTEIEAAKAYNKVAKHFRGEFARLNEVV